MDISEREIRLGYRLGIYDFRVVQGWVDQKISELEEPCDVLVDLSFKKQAEKQEIYSLLSSLANSEENDESLIKVLGAIQENNLNSIEFCRELAKKLYAYYVDLDYEIDERLAEIGFLDDAYDLAERGIFDTVANWHQKFREFICGLKNC